MEKRSRAAGVSIIVDMDALAIGLDDFFSREFTIFLCA
jgi:hypothetical protein